MEKETYSNQEFKDAFLKRIERDTSPSTYRAYKDLFTDRLFLRNNKPTLRYFEDIVYKKDIYDFNVEELRTAYMASMSKNAGVVKSKQSMIKKYRDEAMAKNLTINNIDLNEVFNTEDIDGMVDAYAVQKRYVTFDELVAYISLLKNPQDQVMFLLVWDGIMGEGYSDLLNIEIDNIDIPGRKLKVNGRTYEINPYTAKVIESTIRQKSYHRYLPDEKHDEPTLKQATDMTIDLDNPYLFRSKKSKKNTGENGEAEYVPLSKNTINRRVFIFQKYMGNKYLTLKTIYTSGLVMKIIKEENLRKQELSYTEIQEYIKEHNYSVDVETLKDAMVVIREKLEKEAEDK